MASYDDVPECEIVLEEDGDRSATEGSLKERLEKCTKNKGHPTFKAVGEIMPEHLPVELRDDNFMRFLKKKCELTVKIEVRYTSAFRPDTDLDDNSPYPYSECRASTIHVRFGTGTIQHLVPPRKKSELCPCPECRDADTPETVFWEFTVKTACHVIFDNKEAECAEFVCFYDSDDQRGCKVLYGQRVDNLMYTPEHKAITDVCLCICVTHDEETVNRLCLSLSFTTNDVFRYNGITWLHRDVMVSHPHGGSKKITAGNILYFTAPVKPRYQVNTPIPFWKDTLCRLPWAPEENGEQRLTDYEAFQDLMTFSKNMNHCIKSAKIQSAKVKEKIDFLLTSGVRMVCSHALTGEWISFTSSHVEQMLSIVTFVLQRRSYNIKNSPLKTLELFDILWLLFRCYLLVIIDVCEKEKIKVKAFQHFICEVFLWNLFSIYPVFWDDADLQKYIEKKSIQLGIKDKEYANYREAHWIVAKIMMADDPDKEGEPISPFLRSLLTNFFQSFYNKALFALDQFYFIEKYIATAGNQFLQPGTEFKLPRDMYFTLPSEAKYTYRYYQGHPGYFVFPPGTKFHVSVPDRDLQVDIPIPDEAQFLSMELTTNCTVFLNYDVDTCKGSSGSSLVNSYNVLHAHRGEGGDNTNRSGPLNRDQYKPGMEEYLTMLTRICNCWTLIGLGF